MDDDGKKKTKAEANKEEEGPRVVTLTESQEELWKEALTASRVFSEALSDVGSPIREFALGLTKLEEAEMWIERGFDMLGIDTYGDEGDDEEEDDEGDESE